MAKTFVYDELDPDPPMTFMASPLRISLILESWISTLVCNKPLTKMPLLLWDAVSCSTKTRPPVWSAPVIFIPAEVKLAPLISKSRNHALQAEPQVNIDGPPP